MKSEVSTVVLRCTSPTAQPTFEHASRRCRHEIEELVRGRLRMYKKVDVGKHFFFSNDPTLYLQTSIPQTQLQNQFFVNNPQNACPVYGPVRPGLLGRGPPNVIR